jgi:predicted AlkP superfamily pyrophosphatase or phosphodiesterase
VGRKLCIINVVGLTAKLARASSFFSSLASPRNFEGIFPALTCSVQASLLTGLLPESHGIVGNGWLYRDSQEIRFWQQTSSLIQKESFTKTIPTCSLFWWFPLGSLYKRFITPRPFYGNDGSKTLAVLDATGLALEKRLGPFPFPAFWGPAAGLASSRWISRAACLALKENPEPLTLVYLPHLDYDFQRFGPGQANALREVESCVKDIVDCAEREDIECLILSEYGLTSVERPVFLNREFRKKNWISIREGPYGEELEVYRSSVLAVCDHQVAQIHVRDIPLEEVKSFLRSLKGVARVGLPEEFSLRHARSGELIALAERDAWFAYPFWLEDTRAPDYARCVDIHRKPGYDPLELFMTSKTRALYQLFRKKIGLRYRMDIVPLDAHRIKGSHGLLVPDDDGPVIIGSKTPDRMVDLKDWLLDYF